MSEHDDDRDLDAFLNRQSPVSKAWREAVAEQRAPEALDAAILAAAAEVRPVSKPKPLPRLRRWRVPIGLAASLVIGIGVLREAQRDDLAREQLLGERAAVAAAGAERRMMDAVQRSDAALARSAELARLGPAEQAEQIRRDKEAPQRQLERPSMPSMPPPKTTPPPEPMAVASPLPPAAAAVADAGVDDQSRMARRKSSPAASSAGLAAKPVSPPAAAMAAPLPSSRISEGWQPARYRDLSLGQSTVDDTLRRYGAPEVDTDTQSNEALLPDGRRVHRLLDYGRKLDPRGRLRLYFDAGSTALAWANLVLDPPLSLAAVQAVEGLVGEGIPRAADAPPCDAQPTPPGEPAWPQIRSWPGQGVQLLLAGPDRVVEISYLERCQ